MAISTMGEVTMSKNGKLKAAMFEAGLTLVDLSQRSGINRTYLSQATNGRLVLRPDEQTSIAHALNVPVEAIF
jgi:transcriptional regulator with XRE-family HTH domain